MQYDNFIKKREKVKQEFLNSNCDDLCNLCTKEWFCSKEKENKNNCFFPIMELINEDLIN